jgi:hypothetical protein
VQCAVSGDVDAREHVLEDCVLCFFIIVLRFECLDHTGSICAVLLGAVMTKVSRAYN